jgi:hypothetical protein
MASLDDQQPGAVARLCRLLGNGLLGKGKVVAGKQPILFRAHRTIRG